MTPALYRYKAFGLNLESDMPIPELVRSADAEVDVRIHQRREVDDAGRPGDGEYGFTDAYDYLAWEAVGAFLVTDGRAIEYEPWADAEPAFISLPLLGPVMALVLHRRGVLTLHGSAILIDGGAAVFLGDKGAGKSTTAAALVRAGNRLLTDDIVAIENSPEGPVLHPGYPQVKLTESAAAAIVLDAAAMPTPFNGFGKSRKLLNQPFDCDPVTPRAAFVLERGDRLATHRLPADEALKALMRFSYVTRFGARVIHGLSAARHLRQCAALAGVMPVYRLTVPDDLDRLDELDAFLKQPLAD